MAVKKIKQFVKNLVVGVTLFWIKHRKKSNEVIVYAGPGIGDALYSMAYVEAYKKKNPQKMVTILVSPKLTDIVSTFRGYDRIIPISSPMREKILFRIWTTDPKFHFRATKNGIFYHMAFCRDLPQRHILERMRDSIFELGPEAVLNYHAVTPQKVTCIPDFYNKCDRIVVINANSNSCHFPAQLSEVLARMASYLNGAGGYIVYTNVIGDQTPIPGTEALRCGLPEFLEIAAHIPFMISVRSGLLDFVVKTGVNLFVLYSDSWWDSDILGICGMANWRGSGVVAELPYREVLDDTELCRLKAFLASIAHKSIRT